MTSYGQDAREEYFQENPNIPGGKEASITHPNNEALENQRTLGDVIVDEQSIFLQALDKPTGNARVAWLDEACGSDSALRERIEGLLRRHEQANRFLEQPAVEATIMEAGLAPAFTEDEACVLGNTDHSVLKSIGQTIDGVPRIMLRAAAEESDDPIQRPSSPEIPDRDADSRYQLQGEIARGGMGAVLKGRDTDLGRELAIKVLLDSHKDKPDVIQRFIEEAQIGGQLQHPGIAPVYELGQFADRRPFFSMKLVKGKTLAALLAEREEPSEDRAKFLGIFEQVCQTMAYAHSRGVIHRDLKPANIMVGAFGEVQVMDWGLAKVLAEGGVADEKKAATRHKDMSVIQTMRSTGSDPPGSFGSAGLNTRMGSVMGTPAYMPPEQAQGEIDRLDERSDVFGLGAILCEILTGKPPYLASDGTDVFRLASRGKLDDCFERMDRCGAEVELIDLAKKMLAVEPEDRLRNAGAVAKDLTKYLRGVQERLKQAELAGAEALARAEHAVRRRKLHIAIAGLMLFLAIGAAFSAMRFRQQREVQAGLATRNDALARENAKKRKEAELARERIGIEKENVEEQKDLAVANEAQAIALQKTLQRELYVADMQLLQQAYHDGASNRVDALLQEQIPADGEADPRGWEWYYWWRVSHLHLRQFGATHPLETMAISPEGTWLAVRRWQQDVFILDARTLEQRFLFSAGGNRRGWTEFAISPDGSFFGVIASEGIRIWRTEDWSELPSLGVDLRLRAITFSSSGLLAAADQEGRVTFWDVQQEKQEGAPLETGRPLRCLVFSPDGSRLATGHPAVADGLDATLLVWDLSTRELRQQLGTRTRTANTIAWSDNGKADLIAAGFDDGTVRLWDGSTYAQRDWLTAGGRICILAFSPDGEKLAAGTASNNAVVVWDAASARPINVIKGHYRAVRGVGFAPDNQTVWSCSEDGFLKTWDLARCEPFTRLRGSSSSDSLDYLLFGADGRSLWHFGWGGELARWNPVSGDSLPPFTDARSKQYTVMSDNGRFLAVFKPEGNAGNRLQIWRADVENPVMLSDHVLPDDNVDDVPSPLTICDDGSVVAWSRGHNIVVLNLSTDKEATLVSDTNAVGLALSPDGKMLIEQRNWDAHLWNLGGDGPPTMVVMRGAPVGDAQFSPDGKYLALALYNNILQLHDAATGEVLHEFSGHAGGVNSLDFSPDSALLASGGNDGTVRVWDVPRRSPLLTLSSHDQPVSAVAFSPDGQTIASISYDGDTRLWKGGTESDLADAR